MPKRQFLALLVPVFLLILPTQHCKAQNSYNRDFSRFVRWSYQDAGHLAQTVGPKAPLIALAGSAVLYTGMRIDEPFQGNVRESYRPSGVWGTYLNVTNEFGGPMMRVPAVGIFAATLLTKNTKLQDAAFTSLQSWLYSGIISYGMKYAFGRYRPEDGLGANRFQPFSPNTSFPSGHTVAAFALITPWVLYYPHPVTYGLFAISTGTAISRMARSKHWPTDVVAGAAIGFFTGRHLVRQHTKKEPLIPGLNISTAASANSFVVTAKW